MIDSESSGTKFEVQPGLTSISILDYTLTKHVNFEADIHLPEDEGVVQVETFGVSMNADGTVFYGMQVEAVMDRIKDNISLDHLSRLLVDVHIDSSTIVDSTISAYQRRLLNLVFDGDAENRDKVRCLGAVSFAQAQTTPCTIVLHPAAFNCLNCWELMPVLWLADEPHHRK